MRVIFLNKRLFITILISCASIISGFFLNQPAVEWQENYSWQVKVYQRADQMMSANDQWLMINELCLDLTRQNRANEIWCLKVYDSHHKELFPGVSSLVINYSEDYEILSGYALDNNNNEIMNIDEFFRFSLFGSEFFIQERKKYHSLGLLFNEKVKMKLSKAKGRSAWYDKNEKWWVIYESASPPIKAELTSYND